jgi:hypothetical protein
MIHWYPKYPLFCYGREYADNNVIFMDHNIEQRKTHEIVIAHFWTTLRLKNKLSQKWNLLLGCEIGSMSFTYLGIPMIHGKLRNNDWRVVIERIEKKLCAWWGKLLSARGRLVVLNSVLCNLSIFMMSFFEIPKEVLKGLDQIRSKFFWEGEREKKYHLTQ